MNLLVLAVLPLIQAPEAPFVEKPVELETPALVLKSDRVEAGTKALTWQNREDNLEIVANGRAVAKFQTRVTPTFPGWQPFWKFETEVGTDAITRSYAFGMTKDKKGLFTQRFSVRDGKAVVVSQFTAAEGVPLEEQTTPISIARDYAKGRLVRFTDARGGTKEIRLPEDDAWDDRKDRSKHLWSSSGYCSDPVSVTFDPEHPEYAYTLSFKPGTFGRIVLYRSEKDLFLYPYYPPANLGKPVEMSVDFGRAAKPTAGDCVIEGINFTKNNDFEVPRWGRRNLINNPSFEGDCRYWHDVVSASMVNRFLTNVAHTGRSALRLGGGRTFCVATKPNRKYTFSCWAKSTDGKGGGVTVETCNYTWGGGNVRATMKLKSGTTDWQRLTHTFDWTYRGTALTVHAAGRKSGGVIIDDVQLEEGETATDFECPPFAAVLKTDSPDRYYGDAGQVFNPRLVVRGEPGRKGGARIRVEDFFGRETHRDEKPFEIAENGEAEFPACPESAVALKGVNVIRVELDDGSGRPVVDHLRVVRYAYASGDEPNRELHQNEGFGWTTRNQLKYDPVNWYRVKSQGLNVFSRDLGDWWGVYDEKMRKDIADWYIGNGGRIKQTVFPGMVREKDPQHPVYHYLHEEGIAWDNMPDRTKGYTEAELAAVERVAYRLGRENPWCTDWIGTSELGVRWDLTKTHNYKAYVKILMAAHRGLKRANPKNVFIAHGTCNAGQQGRAELHEVMEATLAVDPNWAWDGLQVHPYRSFPEFPSLENDLRLLFEDMARHNMPNGLVYADEGAYFYPLIVKEWNDMAPWAGTMEKDQYVHMHAPCYDMSWGERVATAMLLRYNLQCYRFIPRIRFVTSWNLRTLDTYEPWAIYLGTAAETELIGSATLLKSVRFGDGARAYFFDDGKDRAVAAIWKFNVALDKGLEKAAEMRVDPAFLDGCEIFDLMANRCRAEDGRLPLSNYPVYLRVPKARLGELVAAVETCKTSDDGKVRKLYDPAPIEVPYAADARPDWSRIAPVRLPTVSGEAAAKREGRVWTGPDDLSAECRLAWSEKGLHLRVDVKDDVFCIDRSTYRYGECQWYACEGVQVFFDNLGDARENFKMEMTGFDQNDSVYELLPTDEKTAVVFRRVAPDIQQTGGVGDPLKANVLVPEVTCVFAWDASAKTRTYEAFFPARQLMPMQLKAGSRIGCSFQVFDRDRPGRYAKQSVRDVPADQVAPYEHPHVFSNFILK